MGQKVSPTGFRVGVNKDWESKWIAKKTDVAKYINNDIKIRKYLEKNLKDAGISKIEIERNKNRCEVIINTCRPGVIIGRGGEEINKLKQSLSKLVDEEVSVSIMEVKNPDLDAQIVADNISKQRNLKYINNVKYKIKNILYFFVLKFDKKGQINYIE